MGEESGPIRPDVFAELARSSRGRTSNCGACQVLCSVLSFFFFHRGVTKMPLRKTNRGCHICFYARLVTVWRDLGRTVTLTCLRRADKEEVPTAEAWERLRMSVGRRECLKVWT